MEGQIDPSEYKIGWICALPLEFTAATAVLDKIHSDIPCDESDNNAYKFGRVGSCNIIIAGLPSGVYGTTSAATVATNLRRSFPSVTACLVVGIGGAAPLLPQNDIRLGDVVVSHPVPGYGGVLQYDYGKTVRTGKFEQTGVLNKPPDMFLTAITKLKSQYPPLGPKSLEDIISKVLETGSISATFYRPSPEINEDRLFNATYDHPPEYNTCENCDPNMILDRPSRSSNQPHIHYGLIASGNQVMKHGATRDRLSRETNILCFEMEAAGVMDQVPSLIIRGICDYSDSHKNKIWQHYAALVAAVYARELLLQLRPLPPMPSPNKKRKAEQLDSNVHTREIFECLQVLGATNPADDKARIEQSKDKLIKDSYFWILANEGFQQWLSGSDRSILRIAGDPGKGKTMIMIGMISHLIELYESEPPTSMAMSYFFCQAADSRLNNALAILKGLISQLISNTRHTDLVRHLKREINLRGKNCFSGPNAFYALERIFLEICRDPQYENFCFMIDALDECTADLEKLLNLICSASSGTSKIRWLITSRNRPDIESYFEYAGSQLQISLELNNDHIESTVNTYINSKLLELGTKKRYSPKVREEVASMLREKAAGTFLWVHLACKELEKVYAYNAVATLKNLPSGLNAFYKGMLEHLHHIYPDHEVEVCSQILSAAVVAIRPLHLREMVIVAGLPTEIEEYDVEVQVKQCGSFLTVQNQTVFFVHQSAKDFLDKQVRSRLVIPYGLGFQHREVARRCLQTLSECLCIDICNLGDPGFPVRNLTAKHREPLLHLQYACYYWVNHLASADAPTDETNIVLGFLLEHLLHWLELFAILNPTFEMVNLVKYLESTMENTWNDELKALLYDLKRFAQYHQAVITEAPLQLYTTAVILSPTNSIIRSLFLHVVPNWIKRTCTNEIQKDWGSVVQVFEKRERAEVVQITFSENDKLLAVAFTDNNIRIWDTYSGLMIQSIKTPFMIKTVLFSPDSSLIAFSSHFLSLISHAPACCVAIWRVASGENVGMWETSEKPEALTWIPGNNARLACAFKLDDIRLFHPGTGMNPEPFIRRYNNRPREEIKTGELKPACLACDNAGNRLASGSVEISSTTRRSLSVVELWDVKTRVVLRQITMDRILLASPNSGYRHSMIFTSDGRQLLFGSPKGVSMWDLTSSSAIEKISFTSKNTRSTQFLQNGTQIAHIYGLVTKDAYEIEISDVLSGARVRQIETPSLPWMLNSNGTQFAACRPQIRLFDIPKSGGLPESMIDDFGKPRQLRASPNGKYIAMARDRSLCIWQHDSFDPPLILEQHENQDDDDDDDDDDSEVDRQISCVIFSPDSRLLASCSRLAIKLWDTESGALVWKLEEKNDGGDSIAFSPNGKLASAFGEGKIRIITIGSEGAPVLDQNQNPFNSTSSHGKYEVMPNTTIKYSPDGSLLASAGGKGIVNLWDVATGQQLLSEGQLKTTLSEGRSYYGPASISFSQDGKLLVFAFKYNKPSRCFIWNLASQNIMRSLPYEEDIEVLSFTENSQFLRINNKIHEIESMDAVLEIENWLSVRGKRLLYFPPHEKPVLVEIQQDLVFIATSSGRLMVVEVPWLYPEEPCQEDTYMDDAGSRISPWLVTGSSAERLR